LVKSNSQNLEFDFYFLKSFNNIPNKTMNVLLSKQNFESLKDKELELIDYTTYATPLYRDLYTEKNPIIKKFKILQYTLKFKKPYFQEPDGEHAFILLKKSS